MVHNFDLNELPVDEEDEDLAASIADIHDGQATTSKDLHSGAVHDGIASVASSSTQDSRVSRDGDVAMCPSPSGCNASNSIEENTCDISESQPTADVRGINHAYVTSSPIVKDNLEIGHNEDRGLEPNPTVDPQGTQNEVVSFSSSNYDEIGNDEDRALDLTSDTPENLQPNPTIDSQDTKNQVVSPSSRNSDQCASNLRRRNLEVLAGSGEDKENHKGKEMNCSTGNALAKRIKKETSETNSNFTPRTYKRSSPAHHSAAPPHSYPPDHHRAPPPPSRIQYPGFVLKCNTSTKREYCTRHCIFGLSASQSKTMEGIKPDTVLFLFDDELDLLNGIYIATTNAGLVFEQNSFGRRYSTQVRFEIRTDCYPLPLTTFKDLKERSSPWRSRNFFGEGLSKREVDHLSYLFCPKPIPRLFPHSLQPFTAAEWVKIAAGRPDNRHTQPYAGIFGLEGNAIAASVSLVRALPTLYRKY